MKHAAHINKGPRQIHIEMFSLNICFRHLKQRWHTSPFDTTILNLYCCKMKSPYEGGGAGGEKGGE